MRRVFTAVALCAAIGCSSNPVETASKVSSPDDFAGGWRSVTPSLEFVRLSVNSTSSQMGVLAARLTLSGLAWEGAGRIEGDSLVASMSIAGTPQANAVMVARASDRQTLQVEICASGGTPFALTLVRED